MRSSMDHSRSVRIDKEVVHTSSDYFTDFDGVVKYLQSILEDDDSAKGKKWAAQFIAEKECPECHGMRLNKEALSYKIWGKNIVEVANLDIAELKDWLDHVEEHMDDKQKKIAAEIVKELREARGHPPRCGTRLSFVEPSKWLIIRR